MALLLNANDSVNRSYTITKPSPNHPLDANGVGVRTGNMFNVIWESGSIGGAGGDFADTNAIRTKSPMPCEAEKTYTFVPDIDGYDSIWVNYYGTSNSRVRIDTSGGTFTTPQGCEQVRFRVTKTNIGVEPVQQYNAMFNEGSTAKPYEPYGYKIPISSGGVTTNIYLGSTQTTRRIKKLVLTGEENFGRQNISGADPTFARFSKIFQFGSVTSTSAILYASTHFTGLKSFNTTSSTAENCFEMRFASGTTTMMIVTNVATTATSFNQWLADQYAAGTPVTVWYVLATTETATVNEPLMNIGDYADTLSNATAIPTTEGANSITVDTTVQPSEFTATWTGWHNANVKEWDGSQWNE